MIRWTGSPAKDQHLYFTSPSVTEDGRWLAILSERTGSPNVLAVDRLSGQLHQISNNEKGLLHAYVYPYGTDAGLSKASPSMDGQSGQLVWIQDQTLWTARLTEDLQTEEARARPVLTLPKDAEGRPRVGGFTHVSRGGELACVPLADAAAFNETTSDQTEQMHAALNAFHRGGLETLTLVVDLQRGEVIDEMVVPFWVTHVQFSAKDPARILFNQEGHSIELVSQRIWAWQRRDEGLAAEKIGVRPLYMQLASEWACHENFDPGGEAVIYHGGDRVSDAQWFERRDWDGRLLSRHASGGTTGQHAIVGTDGQTVLLDPAEDLWAWNMRTDASALLCRHGSSRGEQDCHVHPVMNPGGDGVVFTSDRGGVANVYEWRKR
jgi:hypothetical protein